ncbi:hypothetical protein [Aeromonas allosaccharophila]|uniref:hypothetical protein n=1 Tax=Aeromonas allosaccharophila TaxID=656 RepID=UPI003D1C9EFD
MAIPLFYRCVPVLVARAGSQIVSGQVTVVFSTWRTKHHPVEFNLNKPGRKTIGVRHNNA